MEQLPSLVVLAPHDLRWPGDPVSFEARKQQVFLALIVFLDIHQPTERVAPGHEVGRCLQVGRERAKLGDDFGEGLVLAFKRVERVSRWGSHLYRLDQDLSQHLTVQVAHALHFLHRHPARDQLLLHRRDLGRGRLPDQRSQRAPHLVGVGAAVQLLDDLLQRADSLGPIVDELAHDVTSWWFPAGRRGEHDRSEASDRP
jgi:hypothetical protein